jgi:hypothetical protein
VLRALLIPVLDPVLLLLLLRLLVPVLVAVLLLNKKVDWIGTAFIRDQNDTLQAQQAYHHPRPSNHPTIQRYDF